MPDCGRHSAEEKAFIEHEIVAARRELVGLERLHGCPVCGVTAWASALGAWDAPPVHCGTESIALPSYRETAGA